jgi:uncharacterized protein (UPF0248 family)
MREHPLKSLLSTLRNAPGEQVEAEVVYRHRGAPNDEMKIMVSAVSRLGKGWFTLDDGETQIPYHRVLYVRNLRSGEVLWEKRVPGQFSDPGP